MADISSLLKHLEERQKARRDELKNEFQAVRGNRPAPEMLEHIKVNCYDQTMTIQQLCSISVKPPRELVLQAWDEGVIPALAKAIEDAKLGLAVSKDGNLIRAILPQLTNERREQYMKIVRKSAEEARIGVRHVRDEAIKEIKSAETNKEITEDQFFKTKGKIQNLTDEANRAIDAMVDKKIEELQE